MFRLLKLEVVHWDYWQRFAAPLDAAIVTIVGPNGSGKTTLLDALRTLFALECSRKRDYKRYARKNNEEFCWLRGVVDNRRSVMGRHPFFPILADRVTLACRIEKKGGDWARQYCIAENDADIERLRELGVWMGVVEYRRRLMDAGLTPAIAQVLSLEQGQTDKLCELSAKALLDLVFQVFGDKQVLDRYQEAKLHQEATTRELKEIDAQLAKLDLDIERLTSQVNRFREWQGIRREREMLAVEIKPRLENLQLFESIRGARVQLTGVRRDYRAKEAERNTLASRIPQLQAAIEAARADYTRAEQREQQAITVLNAVNKEIGAREQQLKERERLLRLAEQSGISDSDTTTKRLGEAERDRAILDARLLKLRHDAQATEETQSLLEQGQRADPPDVRELRTALDDNGVAHDLLPEIVEVLDPNWQAAVEAALASFRHIVLLRKELDRSRAFSLGEKLRYRHFIVPERETPQSATPGSLLEIVRFSRPAPPWLIQILDRTQRVEDAEAGARLPRGQDWITRIGYLRERRGGRYAGVRSHEFHFGRARIIALRETLLELRTRIAEMEKRRESLSGAIELHRTALAGVDATKELAARAEEFANAERELETARENASMQGERLANEQRGRIEANERLQSARREVDNAESDMKTLTRVLAELEQKPARTEQKSRILRLRHDRTRLPRAWRELAANQALQAKYGAPANIDMRIREIEQRLETEDWITDETVVFLLAKLKEDFARQSQEQERRRIENERAHTLTEGAREAYVDVLRATVRHYKKNLIALGEIAQVTVDAQLPLLAADDATLAQAGLDVKFDFDRKGFIGMHDGDASGGQQVMKSLILLMALMMEESRPGGFVFDEPFAHLDIFNIDRVASFLRATQAQYLITTPITHNVNVYDPAMLTLVTFKKRPNEAWAPRVGKLVRDHAA